MTDAPLRLVVGLGDSDRESRILPALGDQDGVRVVERCLSADQLLEAAAHGRADAVLLAFDLHRLGSGLLADLDATRIPRVMLVADPEEPRWQAERGVVLPLEADAPLIVRGLQAAIQGERLHVEGPDAKRVEEPVQSAPKSVGLGIIGVGSGPGSPGRTTVALNIATALGAVAPTVLVDADMSGPSIAAHLDADPTRNIYMVAHAEPDAAWEWDRAIQAEVQPLERNRSPYADLLCGVPKPDMRGRITRRFLERLVSALQRRYRYVVLDTGGEILGADGSVHRAALALSEQVLLVCGSDLVGLFRARTTLGLLHTHVQISRERVALVVNRHDPRFHHGRTEIEWALGASTACIVPYDHAGVQRSLAAQRPVVLGRGAAARALLDLAERVHGGKVVLPPERERSRGMRWPQVSLRLQRPGNRVSKAQGVDEAGASA
jgi:MinD-like ATPase involved in chromosome partitioning or flagellar assembly